MLNASFNIKLSGNLKSIAINFTIITIVLGSLTVLLDLVILIRLIHDGKFRKRSSKSISRRIGLLHSMNTYIHIIGITTTFLTMASRTLFSDAYIYNKQDSRPSWNCRVLNCLVSIFSSGIYGSCFLHALFRFWRITMPHRYLIKKISFHVRLIILHWIVIVLLSIPVWFCSVYIPSENYCLNHPSEIWSSVYISIITAGIPVTGIIIVYVKIVLYMKHEWPSRKRWKRMKRDATMIKRIILLVFVLMTSSSAAILLWLLVLIQNRIYALSYRILCFMIEIGMLVCSITLLIVSPQLKRTLQFIIHHDQPQRSINTADSTVPVSTEIDGVRMLSLNDIYNP